MTSKPLQISELEDNSVVPKRNNLFTKKVGLLVLKLMGWKVTGKLPEKKKFILAVAPHTSNWDFIVCVAVMLAIDLKVKYLGKDAIFVWPIKGLLESFGGIPVDRKSSHGVVGQLVRLCNESEHFVLGIAPEGTRSKTKEWKTGFLNIASKANIPVVPVSLHFDTKEVRIREELEISPDIEQELTRVKLFYKDACAKNPQAV